MSKAPVWKLHHDRIVNISISASAFRNQGDAGMMAKARSCLSSLDLNEFAHALKGDHFTQYLDSTTHKLWRSMKSHGGQWGTARKGLNIFLRDVLYSNFFFSNLDLRSHHGNQLEVPLDSFTGKGIKEEWNRIDPHIGKHVPRWRSVRSLSPKESAIYQEMAAELVKRGYAHLTRVDLDLVLWRKVRDR
jgi:hypothetical protein